MCASRGCPERWHHGMTSRPALCRELYLPRACSAASLMPCGAMLSALAGVDVIGRVNSLPADAERSAAREVIVDNNRVKTLRVG